MRSFDRLSTITGYGLDKFREIFNNDISIMPDKEVLPEHLMLLCEKAHNLMERLSPREPLSYILVSDETNFYRGVILEDNDDSLTIAYMGHEGKREIIKMNPDFSYLYRSPDSSYRTFLCYNNQSIRAFPIDFSDTLFTLKEHSYNEEFDRFEQYDFVSIGHNSNGSFFMDRNNNRISVYFDSIHRYTAGCFVIKKDSFFGTADNYGQVILFPRFCSINSFSEGLAAICGYKTWGFINNEGIIVIPLQYLTVEPFNNGLSRVSVSYDLFGLINKEGNGVIIKDSLIEFPEYFFITQEGDSFCGFLHEPRNNYAGQWVEFSIPALNSSFFISHNTGDYLVIGDCIIEKKDGHKFLYSHDGDSFIIIDDCKILDYCREFNKKTRRFDGEIVRHIRFTELPFFYIVSQGGKKGVVNNAGDIIVPIEYEYIGLLSSQVILAYNDAGMRLFSTNPLSANPTCGEAYTQPYERIEKKEESYDSKSELNQYYVYNTNKVGFIIFKDGAFKTVFPCVYDSIDYSYYSTYNNENRHVGTFKIDGLTTDHQILGKDGKYIEKPKDISWMTDFSYSGIAVALKEDRFGLVDYHFITLRDYSYNTIFKIDAFHFLLSKDNHVELIRFNRKYEESVITEFPGTVVSRLSSFIFRVLRSGKYFIYKYKEDKEVLSELFDQGYDNAFGIDESFIVVEENGLSGCFDNEGRELLGIKYDSIVPLKNRNEYYQKKSAINLTVNKIILGYYPLDNIGEYLCDLYNIESRNLLHIPSSWFYDESSKQKYPGSYGIVRPGNWFNVNYVDEYTPNLGVYISVYTISKQIHISTLDCQRFEGPFDIIEPFYSSGQSWGRSFQGLSTYVNGKRGFIRLNPFDAIPCVFDYPVCFVDRSSRFWIIEKSIGEETKKSVYDSVMKRELDLGNVASIVSVTDTVYKVSVLTEDNEPKCGLVDTSFRQIVPLSFDSISNGIKDQFIVYTENWGYGIIDKVGNYVYPLSPGKITFQWRWGENRGFYYFYDENEVLSAVSEDGYLINDVIDGIEKEFIPNSKNHFISDKEESGIFNVCTSFGEKFTGVEETYTEDDITILKTTDGCFAINTEKRITPSFHEVITINKRLGYLTVKDGRHRQFVDFKGVSLSEIEGDYVGCLLYKEAGVITTISKKEDGRIIYKLVSLNGDAIVDTEFSYIGSFNENYATCVINSENPIDKAFFKGTKEESFFAFNHKNYGQWGIINNKGAIVIPMKFDFIRPVKNGKTIYVKDRKYGLINLKEKYRTAPIFKFLFSFSEGLCAFREFADKLDGGWHYQFSDCGLINEKGQIVVPAAYYKIYAFKDGIANVESSSHFLNQIDHEGNLLHEWKKLPSREEPYDDYDEGYTQSELDDMYRAAFEGDPSAQWNID